jgi:hypothetical protein
VVFRTVAITVASASGESAICSNSGSLPMDECLRTAKTLLRDETQCAKRLRAGTSVPGCYELNLAVQ